MTNDQLELLRKWTGKCNKSLNGNYVEDQSCQYSFIICTQSLPMRSGRGGAGTNYWGPAVRKGGLGLTMLHMFLSFPAAVLSVDCTN